jgi:hypothetical protein
MSEAQNFDGAVTRNDFYPLSARTEDLAQCREVIPRSYSKTFGRSAVMANAIQLYMDFAKSSVESEMSDNEFYDIILPDRDVGNRTTEALSTSKDWYDRQIQLNGADLADGLATARQELADLDRYGVGSLDMYMDLSAPPLLRYARTAAEYSQFSWSDWIKDGASDEELLNILEWHNHVVEEQQQNQVVSAEIESNRRATKNAIIALGEAGQVVVNAEDLSRIDSIQIAIRDSFDTRIASRLGYYSTETDIVLAQGIGRTVQRRIESSKRLIQDILSHEMVHGVLNKAHDMPVNPLEPSWINEPLTEMLATLIREHISWHDEDGRPIESDTYFPAVPKAYLEDIGLIKTLLAGRNGESTDITTIAAFRGMTGGYEMAMQFSKLIDEVWGQRDVLLKLKRLIADMKRSALIEDKDLTAREAMEKVLPVVNLMLEEAPDGIFRDKSEERRVEVLAAWRDRRAKRIIS